MFHKYFENFYCIVVLHASVIMRPGTTEQLAEVQNCLFIVYFATFSQYLNYIVSMVGSLFNDAFSVTILYGVDDMISEL
jgi:hypothetical protein